MSNVMEEYEKMGYCPNCKKLKALDIIIKNEVDINWLKYCCQQYVNDSNILKNYNKMSDLKITFEEYKAIKEIME